MRPDPFREAVQRQPRLSLRDLLDLHGDASAAVLVLAMLCVVPLYGVGTALSFAIAAMAWHWRPGADEGGASTAPRLPARLASITLDETWSRRCLHGLAWMYAAAGRLLRERWALLGHRHTVVWWRLWIALMAALIFLPLPLGNVLPSLSLVLMSLGWMFRDGLALLLSTAVGAGAMAFAWASTHLMVELVVSAWRWAVKLVA